MIAVLCFPCQLRGSSCEPFLKGCGDFDQALWTVPIHTLSFRLLVVLTLDKSISSTKDTQERERESAIEDWNWQGKEVCSYV